MRERKGGDARQLVAMDDGQMRDENGACWCAVPGGQRYVKKKELGCGFFGKTRERKGEGYESTTNNNCGSLG